LRLVALAFALAFIACRKHPGSSCTGRESLCLDKGSALVCRNGAFTAVTCHGPLGCAKAVDRAACDTSAAKPGDACMGDDDEHACTADKSQALVCKGGVFERELECRGKGGCSMLGRIVSCDASIATKGDPCKTHGSVACGEDQKHMLICQEGRFRLYRQCRGAYGCFLKGADTPSCDETLSLAGDPCGIAGQVVCSVDGKSELVCQGGSFVPSISCRKGCTVSSRPGRPIDCN
jgi:hypothetical protein